MFRSMTLLMLSLLLLPFAATADEQFSDPARCGGVLMGTTPDGETVEFPLQNTQVDIEVSGFVARATVTQTYGNPYDSRIEAVYTFPLPSEAAVDQMTMVIGPRTIKGEIMKRAEAREVYEEARKQGKTAALLEQERPNIFTQSVANIQPGDEIKIEISYVDILKYEDGEYELTFPMVVGPRYMPGIPIGRDGTGTSPDTDKVPDASKISPPVLPEGMRSGHDIALNLYVDAGVPIQGYESISHEIDVDDRSRKGILEVNLAPEDTIPNKDFVFRYTTAGKRLETALLTHEDDEYGYFTLIMQPKADYREKEITPKEMFFVMDTSGSMHGHPLEVSKASAIRCIEGMNLEDTFQIVQFNTQAQSLFPEALPNTTENVRKGVSAIKNLRGGGGTDPLSAVRKIASIPQEEGRIRIIFFMTDGYVGNEREIMKNLAEQLGDCRVFVLGVGSSPNRYLLDGMAEVGRGAVQYVNSEDDASEIASTFYRRVANPVVTDIQVDFSDLDPDAEVYPFPVPDLFDVQPLYLHGRVKLNAKGDIRITGNTPRGEFEDSLYLNLATDGKYYDTMAKVWARKKIKSFERGMIFVSSDEDRTMLEKNITDTALQYGLMSQYTSFVAVEENPRGESGEPMQVVQPVELPEGMSRHGAGMAGSRGATMTLNMKAPSVAKQRAVESSGYQAESMELADDSANVSASEPASPPVGDGDAGPQGNTETHEDHLREEEDERVGSYPHTFKLPVSGMTIGVDVYGKEALAKEFLQFVKQHLKELDDMALRGEFSVNVSAEVKVIIDANGQATFEMRRGAEKQLKNLPKFFTGKTWKFSQPNETLRVTMEFIL